MRLYATTHVSVSAAATRLPRMKVDINIFLPPTAPRRCLQGAVETSEDYYRAKRQEGRICGGGCAALRAKTRSLWRLLPAPPAAWPRLPHAACRLRRRPDRPVWLRSAPTALNHAPPPPRPQPLSRLLLFRRVLASAGVRSSPLLPSPPLSSPPRKASPLLSSAPGRAAQIPATTCDPKPLCRGRRRLAARRATCGRGPCRPCCPLPPRAVLPLRGCVRGRLFPRWVFGPPEPGVRGDDSASSLRIRRSMSSRITFENATAAPAENYAPMPAAAAGSAPR